MLPGHLEKYAEKQPVLDHGFVRLVDLMGDDSAVVQAARVSTGGGLSEHELVPDASTGADGALFCTVCKGHFQPDDRHCVKGDRQLIRYLFKHRHTTPLEMCEVKLHVKLPIFVARQWIRHRTANVNEKSGRYSILAAEYYLPGVERIQKQSAVNKQGSGEGFGREMAMSARLGFDLEGREAHLQYRGRTNAGMAKELARLNLPLSTYTEWYWKIDLHNLLHFLALRLDSHAQYEIRQYAEVIGQVVADWCPMVWEAFNDYHPMRGARTFSAQEMEVLQILVQKAASEFACKVTPDRRAFLKHWKPELDRRGMTQREKREFWEDLALGLAEW